MVYAHRVMKRRIAIVLSILLLQITHLQGFYISLSRGQRSSVQPHFWNDLCSRKRRQVVLPCQAGGSVPTTSWDPYSAPKLDFDECYYNVLEVGSAADAQQIKKAYYKLVSKYHPDTKEAATDKELANKQMMVINNAYKILKDQETREEYDRRRAIGYYGAEAGIKGAGLNDPKYARPKTRPAPKPTPKPVSKPSPPPFTSTANPFQEAAQAFRSAANSADYWKGTNIRKVFNRGDGSLSALKLYLASLRYERDLRLRDLESDTRDWATEKDISLVYARIKDIDEYRTVKSLATQIEDEVESLSYTRSSYDSSYSSSSPYNSRSRSTSEDYYEPQPQPQRQRSDAGWKVAEDWEEVVQEEERKERRWRDYNDRRRSGRMSMQEEKIQEPEQVNEAFLKDIYTFFQQSKGANVGGSSIGGSSIGGSSVGGDSKDGVDMTVEDLLSTSDYYHNLADQYDRFASSHDPMDFEERNEGGKEMESFWGFLRDLEKGAYE